MPKLRTIFLLGKGGTGKSTTSALLSLVLAKKGKRVLLTSFDHAHNLCDIFQTDFGEKPVSVGENLEVSQIDQDREIKAYLEKTVGKIKSSYTYLTAFNLENYFDVLKFSPGMEEYALVTALLRLQSQGDRYDCLIIDMPPTALSLRFFNLPSLSLTWVAQLEKLRLEIHRRKEIVSRIKFAGKEFERDKVLSGIQEIKSEYQELKAAFENPDLSSFVGVMNNDLLSITETRRIVEGLAHLNISLNGLVCNVRIPGNELFSDLPTELATLPVERLPFSPAPLVGLEALTGFIREERLRFSGLR